MRRKIVFLDVDGTLVSDGGAIPDSAREACARAKAKGVLLCVATGRQYGAIGDDVMSIGFDAVISAGGARIDINGTMIHYTAFSKEVLSHIIRFFEERSIGCTLERSDCLLASRRMFEYFRQEQGRYRDLINLYIQLEHVVEGELSDAYTDVAKVVFGDIGALSFHDIQQEFEGECAVFRGSMPFYGEKNGELCPYGIDKGVAVKKVLESLGIPREDSYAIGDGDNDRAMFEACAHGIAMGNAAAALQRAAEFVTTTVENDGIHNAFAHYGVV